MQKDTLQHVAIYIDIIAICYRSCTYTYIGIKKTFVELARACRYLYTCTNAKEIWDLLSTILSQE